MNNCSNQYDDERLFELKLTVFLYWQDDQPDIQGLAVTLVGGRSSTESPLGTLLCFVDWFGCIGW